MINFSEFFNRKITIQVGLFKIVYLDICSNLAINTFINEIKDCGMYSIMCDEARY